MSKVTTDVGIKNAFNGVIKESGLKTGQMHADVGNEPDWLIKKLQGEKTDEAFYNEWVSKSSKHPTIVSSLNQPVYSKVICESDDLYGFYVQNPVLFLPATSKEGEVVYDKIKRLKPRARPKKYFLGSKVGTIPKKYRILLSKTPDGFVHKCQRGFTALRFNGLLKQKCKKGMRKHYPTNN